MSSPIAQLRGLFPAPTGYSPQRILLLSVTTVALGFCFGWPGQMSTLGYWLSALLMLGVWVLPLPTAAFVLLALLAGPDIVQGQSEVKEGGEALVGSPWRLGIAGISPGIIQALIYVGLILRLGRLKFPPGTKLFIAYAGVVGVLGATISFLRNGEFLVPVQVIVSDARIVLFFAVAAIAWYQIALSYPSFMYRLCQLLLLIFVARLITDATLWFTDSGARLSGAPRGSTDSVNWTVLVVAFWCVHALAERRRVVSSLILLTGSLLMLFVYMTRMHYISLALGVVAMLVAKRKASLLLFGIPALVGIALAGQALMERYMPTAAAVYMKRLEGMIPLSQLDFQAVDEMRVAQAINCFGEMATDGTIFVGRGFGGFYRDDIVFLGHDLTDAFTDWSAETRRFPTVHNAAGQFILKFGLVGLGLWLAVWIRLVVRLWRVRGLPERWAAVRLILLCSAPAAFFSGYWSSKGMILTGFFVALGEFLTRRPQASIATSAKRATRGPNEPELQSAAAGG